MRVLITGDRSQDRDRCRQAALGIGLDCSAADSVPLADAPLRLAREPAVHLVLVLADPDPAAAAGTIKYATGQTDGSVVGVVASAAANAQQPLRQAGAAGVWELSRVKEELLRVSQEARPEGATDHRRGRVIAVTAAHPGCGITTVATGVAFGMAGSGSVLLAELAPGTPELALDLEIQPPHSLAELIRASERMDSSMIRHAAAKHPAGVEVLAYPPDTLATEPLSPTAARDFQILLRATYDWAVVDAGPPQDGGTEELLRHADAVAVVTRLDPPSLRLTRQYIKAIVANGVAEASIGIVANRYGQSGQVHWKKAEEALKTTVRAWIPDDPRAANKALVDGLPLVQAAKRASLTRALNKLAADFRTRLAPAAR